MVVVVRAASELDYLRWSRLAVGVQQFGITVFMNVI